MSATTPAAAPSKGLHIALWVVQGLLGLAFLASGAMKSITPVEELAKNPQMAWALAAGATQVKLAGISEVLGALGLILPSALRILPALTPVAASGLVVVMALAANLHLGRNEPVVANIVLGALALFVALGRFKLAPIAPKNS